MRWMTMVWMFVLAAISSAMPADSLKAKIDEMLKANLDGETAVSVAVVMKGEIVYTSAFGFENISGAAKTTAESKFNIASVTKNITSVAVLQLVQAGKLGLDEKLVDIIEDVPKEWSQITVRQMLSHTSGILDYARHPKGKELVVSSHTLSAARAEILSWDLEFSAGEKWAYSNSAYHLLGHVVAAKSGVSYAEYLRENIFDPAGMTHALLDSPGTKTEHRVVGLASGSEPAQQINPNWSFGAGGVICTATDLAKFDLALNSGKLLSKKLLKLAQTPRGGDKPAGLFGLGWIINEKDGATYIGHVGGKPGFDSFFIRSPEADFAVVVLRARTGGAATQIAEKIMRILLEE